MGGFSIIYSIGLAVFGLLGGILSGLIGIGGGVLLIPGLVLLFGLSQQVAQGSTLALLVFPVVILAVLEYNKAGFVDWRITAFLAVGFIIGGYFGAKLAVALPVDILKKIFAVAIILIGIRMLITK